MGVRLCDEVQSHRFFLAPRTVEWKSASFFVSVSFENPQTSMSSTLETAADTKHDVTVFPSSRIHLFCLLSCLPHIHRLPHQEDGSDPRIEL